MSRFIIVLLNLCIVFTSSAKDYQHAIVGYQEQKDLDLLQGKNPGDKALIDFFYKPHMVRSHYSLRIILERFASSDAIRARQEHILYAASNAALLDVYDQLFAQMGEHCAVTERLDNALQNRSGSLVKDLYIPAVFGRQLNKNSFALDAWQCLQALVISMPTLEHLALHYLLSQKLSSALGLRCACPHDHGHEHHHHDHEHDHDCTAHQSPSWKRGLYNVYQVGHMAIHIVGLIALAKEAHARMQRLSALHAELCELKQFLTAAYQAINYICQDERLAAYYNDLLGCRVESLLSSEIINLTATLQHHFNKPNAWYRPGVVLAAYTAYQEARQSLSTLQWGLATIEAELILAKTFALKNTTKSPLSFPQFVSGAYPVITLVDGWNPNMGAQNMSKISISLGGDQPLRRLVTGDNMAGKSTFLKTVATCVLFAHTVGFVPAAGMQLTPFEGIISACSINDSLSQGLSQFAAESAVAEDIVQKLNEQNGPFFIITDELFESTNKQKGAQYFGKFLLELLQRNNHCLLSATHLGDLDSIIVRTDAIAITTAQRTVLPNGAVQYVYQS